MISPRALTNEPEDKMTSEFWRSGKQEKMVEIPQSETTVPHMVDRLLDTVEHAPEFSGRPDEKWWESIKAQARAIREEKLPVSRL
jgi:hypothetical protein